MSNPNKYSWTAVEGFEACKPFREFQLNKRVITEPAESWRLYPYPLLLTRGALPTFSLQ